MKQIFNFLKTFFSQSLRSLNNTLNTIFKLILLISKPTKFFIVVVQFIKSRVFSIILLGISLYIVAVSSMASTALVLKHLFPTWTEDTIQAYAYRSVLFLESVLVYFKLKRFFWLSWFVMAVVMVFSIGSVVYDLIENTQNYSTSQMFVYLLVIGIPSVLSTVLMFVSSNDASKVPKNKKLDKAFTGNKKPGAKFSMSKEDRENLNKQILEHVDHHSTNIGSFREIQSVFQDRVKNSSTISALLKRERPILYQDIRTKQKAGRK
jgi:hypothetical protein